MKNVALITGASSGLWKEFAIIHAYKWWDLVLVARREDKLKDLEKELSDTYNCKVMVIAKDLTAPNAALEIKAELDKFWVQPEYLINNAGFGWIGKFTERKWSDESSMIDLNVTVLSELCHLFLPDMIRRDSWKILNVSSTASLLPGPNQAVYYATKAFVTSLSNALNEELYDSKVSVTALLPWPTDTEFGSISWMDKTSLFSNAASAKEVALDWYEAMISGKLNVISGVSFPQMMLMKMIPLIPKKLILKIVRKWQEVKK